MPARIAVAWRLLLTRRMSQTAIVPVNYRTQNATSEAIASEADYAVGVGLKYARWISAALQRSTNNLSEVADLDVLELGPGPSLGAALVLACGGARVTVADRFAARWDAAYHPQVLRAIAERVNAIPGATSEPIQRVLRAGAFVDNVVAVREYAAEDLHLLAASSADFVVSNAVLEHLADVPRAFASLAHVTRRGGYGLHQVDFRDHRDFSRPLEYLTLSAPDFAQLFDSRQGECGNRWRPRPMAAAFEAAGLIVRQYQPNMHASAGYLEDIQTRLHPDVCPVDDIDLQEISGYFVVQRG